MKRFPIYPFYIGAFAPLSLFAANIGEVHARELAVPLAATLLSALILLAVSTLILRNVHRSAMIVTAFLLWFFTYGQWIKALWIICPWITPQYGLFNQGAVSVSLGLLLLITVYLAARKMKNPQTFTWYMNRLGICLLVCPLAVLLIWRLQPRNPATNLATMAFGQPASALATPGPVRPAVLPDIYLIVLDAHARADVLQSLYGYDDSPFLQHLRDKGFFIADASNSNYCLTELSVGATLNMRYMNEFDGQMDFTMDAVVPALRHNSLMATLRPFGYSFVSFQTLLDHLCFSDADVYYRLPSDGGITAFQQLLINTTALSQLGGAAIKAAAMNRSLDYYHFKRQAIRSELETGPQAARLPGPKFVFIHLLAPHVPFVFAADGSDPDSRNYGGFSDPGLSDGFTPQQYRQGYRDQTIFVDSMVSTLVDKILEDSPTPPVIVLMGDHGSRLRMHWGDPKTSDLHEATANLTAIYLPGKASAGLYRDITPVNIFRVVLNDYFDARLPLLPDKIFFTIGPPLINKDITTAVRPATAVTSLPAAGR